MSAPSVTRAGRARAEALMVDTFTAYAPNSTTTDADGYEVAAYTSQGSTQGKLTGGSRGTDGQSRLVRVGEVDREVLVEGLHLPIEAPIPAAGEYGVGWEYECISTCGDPANVGTRWLVVDAPPRGALKTARRMNVVQL